jgi:8-oxo-dGTP diphosphatase
LTKAFFVYVEGICIRNGEILLVKRNVQPFKGYWHVVGGHVGENETLEEALKREFREETGIEINVGSIVGGRIEETFDRIKIIVVFEITYSKGEIKLNYENEEYGWFVSFPSHSVYDHSKYLEGGY